MNTVLAVSDSVLTPKKKVHLSLINLELINFNPVCSGKNASISCLKQCNVVGTMYNQLCNFIEYLSQVLVHFVALCKYDNVTLTLAGFCNVMLID